MERIKAIKQYYDRNIKNGTKDHEILGWESKEAQNARFAALKKDIPLEGLSLLDVGCGLGNFLEYLSKEEIDVQYTGVDVLPEMIERAKAKGLKGEFICADVFNENVFEPLSFDIVCASGIFNLNLGNNKEFLSKAIELFLRLSKTYVCFNLLHYKSPNKEDTYYYFSPKEAKDIIGEASTGQKLHIEIVEDYLKNDFTVLCKKL